MEFENLKIGMKESISKTITETDIILYSGISLDCNPIHLNKTYAETSRFKKRIAHGMLTAGLISAILGTRLPGERLNRILALSPVLHINEQEALELGGRDCVADAAAALYQITGSPVIVTLGERGAYCRESEEHAYVIPGIPSRVVDTIGAGDSHIGAILAGLQKGSSLRDAIAAANQVAAAVVSQEGAILPKDSVLFRNLRLTKEGLRENTNH